MDAGTIQNYYKDGTKYFDQMKFPDTWKQCSEFKDGNQWPPATERTKNLPRPVINMIRFVENHKVSQILSEPIKMIFSPDETLMEDPTGENMPLVGSELFTQFSIQEWENIKQDDLNEKALNKSAEVCSGIYHYYFDDSVIKGQVNLVKGAMKGEILHPLSVMVGNPQCLDTQLQPYILIPVRDDVSNIKSRAKKAGLKPEQLAAIQGDKDIRDTSDNARYEVREKATEITCYWKEGGFIWLMKVCGEVITKEPVSTEHKLYPIARMNWYEQDKNWYGIGETEGLLANQKSINFITAMQMMSQQMSGMPKLMIKDQYIKSFNNDPAAPIMDKNPSGWSAQYLQPAMQSSNGQELVDFLLSTSKTHAGATEVSSGELAKSSQMNATAIMLLQKASAGPLDQIKKRFKRVLEEIGSIWMEFWTINYNTSRIISIKDENGQDIPQQFRGSDFKGVELSLKITAGASTEYSESIMMTSLDKFLDKNLITFEQYLENAPDSVIPFKEKLIKELKQQQSQQMQSLTPEEQQTISQLPPDQQAQALQQLNQQSQQAQQPIQGQQPQQMPQ